MTTYAQISAARGARRNPPKRGLLRWFGGLRRTGRPVLSDDIQNVRLTHPTDLRVLRDRRGKNSSTITYRQL